MVPNFSVNFSPVIPNHLLVSKNDALRDLLRSGFGRTYVDMIIDAIEHKPSLFEELRAIYLSDEDPYNMKAAWALDVYTETHPERMAPYAEEMAAKLPQFKHDGMKRHTLRMLMRLPLPDRELGTLVNICFDWLASPRETAAAKVYAMEILYRVSHQEPDLKKELADTISWRLDEESPGIQNRGKKILKKLSREI